jgi:lysophospholipase L1-like esterase
MIKPVASSKLLAVATILAVFFGGGLGVKAGLAKTTPYTVTLNVSYKGFYWDAGTIQYGAPTLEVDPSFVANEPTQQWVWTAVTSTSWTICSVAEPWCLASNGAGLVPSATGDHFVLTNTGSGSGTILDMTVGRYVNPPSDLSDNQPLAWGSVGVPWTIGLEGSPVSTGGGSGGGGGGGGGGGSQTVKVMPYGDSITEGYASVATFVQGGYRCPLANLLGSGYTFVGDSQNSVNPGVVTACSQTAWEGHGGYDALAVLQFAESDQSVVQTQPDIILMLLGTNDVAQSETGSTGAQLQENFNYLHAVDPHAVVIVSTIPPIYPAAPDAVPGEAQWATQVPSANAQILTVAAQNSSFVRAVDYYGAIANLDLTTYLGSDGVHPSTKGYQVLAALWKKEITQVAAAKANIVAVMLQAADPPTN